MGRSKPKGLTALPAAAEAPAELEMCLFAPGMTALHRAGLGGLACTLRYIERAYQQGAVSDDDVPGGRWTDPESPPWVIESDRLTLTFGEPARAGVYLKRLFALAFQVKEGVIFLPGQYGGVPPSMAVRSAIQDGIQTTFLQHGPTCGSRTGERTVTIEIDNAQYRFTHDVFTSYKHQGWFWLDRDEMSKETATATGKKIKTGRRVQKHQSPPFVTAGGVLAGGGHELDIKIVPGAITRHERFGNTAVVESDGGLICLHFALVGTITLPVNAAKAVLLVPEVTDLKAFAAERWLMTPMGLEDCRVGGGTDAALQLQVRLHALSKGVGGCHALTFLPTAWAKQQKSRVHTVYVPELPDPDLDVYALALAHLAPRIVVRKEKTTAGKGRTQTTTERQVAFRADSVVRPLIADNLAVGRPWYAGFTRVMTATNPATDRPFREAVRYEQRGLHAMVSDSRSWVDQEGERLVVQAVHEAIRMRYGQIADENKNNPVGMKNRWKRFRERLRLDLAGAKTEAQARFALMDLFSRGGNNRVLQDGWATVLPVVRRDWQLARDLGLLALASYAGRGADDTEPAPPDTPKE
jgi:CRISPR-associated protein Cas8a1/Csx13